MKPESVAWPEYPAKKNDMTNKNAGSIFERSTERPEGWSTGRYSESGVELY